jgi:nitrogen fixation-related uncharacterized protein
MIVLILLAFVSAMLVALAVGLFAWTVRQRTFDHGDHLSLLPLRDDASPSSRSVEGASIAQADSAKRGRPRSGAVGTDDGFSPPEGGS